MTDTTSESGVGEWQRVHNLLSTREPAVEQLLVDTLNRLARCMFNCNIDTFDESKVSSHSAKLSTEHGAGVHTIELLVEVAKTTRLSLLLAHELLSAYVIQYNVQQGDVEKLCAKLDTRRRLEEELTVFLHDDRIAQLQCFQQCCSLCVADASSSSLTAAVTDVVTHRSALGAVVKMVDASRTSVHPLLHLNALQALLWLVHTIETTPRMVETVLAAFNKLAFGTHYANEGEEEHMAITNMYAAVALAMLGVDSPSSVDEAVLSSLATHASDINFVKHAHMAPVYLAWAILLSKGNTEGANDTQIERLLQVAGEQDVVHVVYDAVRGGGGTTHELRCTLYYALVDTALAHFDYRSLADIDTLCKCVCSIVHSPALTSDVWQRLRDAPPDLDTAVTSIATLWSFLLTHNSTTQLHNVVRFASALAHNGGEEEVELIVHAFEHVPIYALPFNAVNRNALTVNDDQTVTLTGDVFPLGDANRDVCVPSGSRGHVVHASKDGVDGVVTVVEWQCRTNVWRLMHHHIRRVVQSPDLQDDDYDLLLAGMLLARNVMRASPTTMVDQMAVFVEDFGNVMIIYGDRQTRYSELLRAFMECASVVSSHRPALTIRHMVATSLTAQPLAVVNGSVDYASPEWAGRCHLWLAFLHKSVKVTYVDDEQWADGFDRPTSVALLALFVDVVHECVKGVTSLSSTEYAVLVHCCEWVTNKLLPIVHLLPSPSTAVYGDRRSLHSAVLRLVNQILSRKGNEDGLLKETVCLSNSTSPPSQANHLSASIARGNARHAIIDPILRGNAVKLRRLRYATSDGEEQSVELEECVFLSLCIVCQICDLDDASAEESQLTPLMDDICFAYDSTTHAYGQCVPLHSLVTHIEHINSSPHIVRMSVLVLRACINAVHVSRSTISLVLSFGDVYANVLADAVVTRLCNLTDDISVKLSLLKLVTCCVQRQPAMAERICNLRWTDAQNVDQSTIDVILQIVYPQMLLAAYDLLLALFEHRSPAAAWTKLQRQLADNKDDIWTHICAPLRQSDASYYAQIVGSVLHICALQTDVDAHAERAINAYMTRQFKEGRLLRRERIALLYDNVTKCVLSVGTSARHKLITALCQFVERNLSDVTLLGGEGERENVDDVRAEWLNRHAQLNAEMLEFYLRKSSLTEVWPTLLLNSSCTSIMLQACHVKSTTACHSIAQLIARGTHCLTEGVHDHWLRGAGSDAVIRSVRCLQVMQADHPQEENRIVTLSMRSSLLSQMCSLLTSLCHILRHNSAQKRDRLMRRIRYTLKCVRHDLLEVCEGEEDGDWLAVLREAGTVGTVVDTIRLLCAEHIDRREEEESVATLRGTPGITIGSLNKSSILASKTTTQGGFLYGTRDYSNATRGNSTIGGAGTTVGSSMSPLTEWRLRLIKTCLSFVGHLLCNEECDSLISDAKLGYVATLHVQPAITPLHDHELHHAILRKLFSIHRIAVKSLALREGHTASKENMVFIRVVEQAANLCLCYSHVVVDVVKHASYTWPTRLSTAVESVALLETLMPFVDVHSPSTRYNEKWAQITNAVGVCTVRMAHEVVQPGQPRTIAHATRHRSSSHTNDRASTISMYDLSTPRASMSRHRRRSSSQTAGSRHHDSQDIHNCMVTLLASCLQFLRARTPTLQDLVKKRQTPAAIFTEFDFASSGVQLEVLADSEGLHACALNYGCLMHITHVVYAALKRLDRSTSPSTGRHSSVNILANAVHADREQLWSIVESAVTLTLSQASLCILDEGTTPEQRALMRHELSSELMDTLKLLNRLCGSSPSRGHSVTPHKSSLRSPSSRMSTSPSTHRRTSVTPSTVHVRHSPFVAHALDYVVCMTTISDQENT